MKNYLLIIPFILTFTLLGCSGNSEQVGTDSNLQEELSMLQEEIKELQQEVNVQKKETKTIQGELDVYKSFVKNDLMNNLDSQQIQSLAESQWEYRLFIDGKEINEVNDIQISKSKFEIKLVETQASYAILPIEVHNKGQISSHIKEQIRISPSNYELIAPAGTNIDSIIYKFDNVSKDTIEIQVTDELKNRLGWDKNIINIEVH
jgi:hypothetical protein